MLNLYSINWLREVLSPLHLCSKEGKGARAVVPIGASTRITCAPPWLVWIYYQNCICFVRHEMPWRGYTMGHEKLGLISPLPPTISVPHCCTHHCGPRGSHPSPGVVAHVFIDMIDQIAESRSSLTSMLTWSSPTKLFYRLNMPNYNKHRPPNRPIDQAVLGIEHANYNKHRPLNGPSCPTDRARHANYIQQT